MILVVDTGSDCNILGKSTWENVKSCGIKVNKQEKGGPDIYGYTSKSPMEILDQFFDRD